MKIRKKLIASAMIVAMMMGTATTAVSYRITCNNGNQRTLINP